MGNVKVGVIGVGAFGESHIIAYKSLPYVTLSAVCDVNAARNLARYAESSPASACGAEGTGREDDFAVKPAA